MERTEAKRQQVLDALSRLPHVSGQGSLTIGQVMTPGPFCIRAETTVPDLIKLFHAKQFRHLLVLDAEDRLAGVLSDRDVLHCLGPARQARSDSLSNITAGQLMSRDVLAIDRDAPVTRAADLMLEHGISCLPVLGDGKLVGILTNTDLNIVLFVLLDTLRQSSPEESFAGATAAGDEA